MAVKQTIGDWDVLRRLGERGERRAGVAPARGRSYLVRRQVGEVAARELHLIDPRPGDPRDLLERVQHFARLHHPALPDIVEAFLFERRVVIVMRHDDGVGLDRLKGYLDRDQERLADPAIWYLGFRLTSALTKAHLARNDNGALKPLVHGHLSLHDVLITWDGDVRLMGLCPGLQVLPVDAPPPSRAWLPPELRRGGDATPASDAFTAALVLRSLLTGRPPPSPGATLLRLEHARDDLPKDVARAIDKALDPDPEARTTCGELEQRLETLVQVTAGQSALRECMELYQALWGLWSVASPDPWITEEPLPLSKKTSDFGPVMAELDELERIESSLPPARQDGTSERSDAERAQTSEQAPPDVDEVASAVEGDPAEAWEEVEPAPKTEVSRLDAIPDEDATSDEEAWAPSDSPALAEAPAPHERAAESREAEQVEPAPETKTSVAPADEAEEPPASEQTAVEPEPEEDDRGADPGDEDAPDAARESEPEAARDSEPEAARDSEPEAARDSEPEAARDSEPEAARDSEPDSGRDSETDFDPAPLPEPASEPAPPSKAGSSAATVAIALGVLIGLALWLAMRGRGEGERQPSPPPRPATTATAPASGSASAVPPPTGTPSASPPVAPAASSAATAVPSATASTPDVDPALAKLRPWYPTHEPSKEAEALPYDRGLLLVRSAADTGVAVYGKPLGRTNRPISVPCRPFNPEIPNGKAIHVQLADSPQELRSEAKAVAVKCHQLTTVRIDAKPLK